MYQHRKSSFVLAGKSSPTNTNGLYLRVISVETFSVSVSEPDGWAITRRKYTFMLPVLAKVGDYAVSQFCRLTIASARIEAPKITWRTYALFMIR
jgi:hypothetical protein